MDGAGAYNPDIYASRRDEIVAFTVIFMIIPTVAVYLRFLSRWIARAGLWWDDYVIVLSLLLVWAVNMIALLPIGYGFGRHAVTLSKENIITWFKYLYAFEFFYALAVHSFKYSIILFLYRIFPVIQFRHVLYGLTIWVTLFTIACVLVSIFQCTPIHAFWDTMVGSRPGGRCINVESYFKASGAINTVTNFVLLALPIPLVWRLRTSMTQRIVLTVIFTAGFAVCAVSIVRIVVLSKLVDADITWTYVTPAKWTAAEPSVAVVACCLPSLRPLIARMLHGASDQRDIKRSSSQMGLTSSWRGSKNSQGSFDQTFERWSETPLSPIAYPERLVFGSKTGHHHVAVRGGRHLDDDEEFGQDTFKTTKILGRHIMVQTTLVQTITDRLDWHDELF